ncbi:MAG: SBBP repeat-containing protein, partial [Chitinophagaceae bacterium]|nr:SBBP repeat-containing protein [Chitinophagaceae bacterium]
MKNIVLICLVLISNILFGQSNPNVFEDWRTTTGVQAFFHKSVTKTDVNNNVYVAGATLNGSGNYDVLVAKYDVNGIQQWIHQINGAADDQDFATALALDNNSNVYITGAITDSITNLSDILTIKYNSNGVLQWMKRYDSSDNLYDSGTDLIVDDGGVVYVTGSVQNANADMDFVTLAYKPSGTLIWASQYNSMYGLNDAGVKINFGKNQNQVCVVGVCQINPTKYIAAVLKYKNNGTLLDSVFTNTNSTEINMVHGFTRDSFGNLYFAGIYDAVGEGKNIDVVKLDTALNIEWEITADYSTLDDEAKSIAVDLLGNVYVGGYFTTTTQGKDAFIRQYDGYGNMNWEKVYDSGMNLDDEINAIVVDGQNNVIISGYATKQNNVDYYTAKYDINGNKKWEIFSDGGYNLEDKITNTAIDELGGVIVTGMSKINSNNY